MKRCPQCGREYDLTMSYCLDDGSELLYGPASASSADEPATAIWSEPPGRADVDRSEPGAIAAGFRSDEGQIAPPVIATDQTAILTNRAKAEVPKILG